MREATGIAGASMRPRAAAVTALLAFHAMLSPIAVAALSVLPFGPGVDPTMGLAALGLALLGPGLAVIVVALRGPTAVMEELGGHFEGEARPATVRVFAAGAVLVYLALLAVWGIPTATLRSLLMVSVPGLVCAWLLFVHLLARPAHSAVRRGMALVVDVAFVTAFLHLGAAYAAPWVGVYLWIALGSGFRFGLPSLAASATLSAVGFALLVATTPYWQAQVGIAVGILTALVLLSGYAATVIRRYNAERAEEQAAIAASRRFARVLRHELRTPMAALTGTLAHLERTALGPEQRDMAATIELSARALVETIETSGSFSPLEGPVPMPLPEGFVLRELLADGVALLRPQAETKALALALDIDPRLPQGYRGWPSAMRQILLNLVGNAIKFSSKGRIAINAILVDRTRDSVRLALAVRDEGVGIPPEELERVFSGDGVGLALSEMLAERIGGQIKVESEPDLGSTFTLEVTLVVDPTARVRAPEATIPLPAAAPAAGPPEPREAPVVTPITAHPKFASEPLGVVDDRTIGALEALGGDDFLREVVDTFRGDARRLLERIRAAETAGAASELKDALHALASSAANVGGARLAETLRGLAAVEPAELRAAGTLIADTIEAELAPLESGLGKMMHERRRG